MIDEKTKHKMHEAQSVLWGRACAFMNHHFPDTESSEKLGDVCTHGNRQYIEFDDSYGKRCHIKQCDITSSDQSEYSSIWLGRVWEPSMCISYKQAIALRNVLNQWIETGKFDDE